MKLSVLISLRNLYNSLKNIKEKTRTYSYIETCITEMFSRDMYEYACTFHNLLFSICSVDHGLNQILDNKNVHDIPIYMFACARICIFTNRIHVARWKIQSITLDASLHDQVDHSIRNIWISTPIQHVNWEGDFFIVIFFCFWPGGVGMKWVPAPFEGHYGCGETKPGVD